MGVGCHALLQGIFPTQRSNPGVPHCRWTLYHLVLPGKPLWQNSVLKTHRITKETRMIHENAVLSKDPWDYLGFLPSPNFANTFHGGRYRNLSNGLTLSLLLPARVSTSQASLCLNISCAVTDSHLASLQLALRYQMSHCQVYSVVPNLSGTRSQFFCEPGGSERWGVAVNTTGASLSHPLFTSCCVAQFLTGGCGPLISIHILLLCYIHAKKDKKKGTQSYILLSMCLS